MNYRKRLFEIPFRVAQDPSLFDKVSNALRIAVWTWAEQPPDTTAWPGSDSLQGGRSLAVDAWDSPADPARRLLTVELAEVRGEATWTLAYSICSAQSGAVTVREECSRSQPPGGSDEEVPPDLTGFLDEFVLLDVDGLQTSRLFTVAQEAKARFLQLLRNDTTQRRLPVVVISPTRAGEILLDARMLSRRLRGLAHVMRLKSDFWWTKEEFAHICFSGSVRLYHAGYRADDKPGEHRFWAADEILPDPEAVARDIIEKVLRDTLALEWSSPELDLLERERDDAHVAQRFQEQLAQLRSSMLELEEAQRELLFADLSRDYEAACAQRDEYKALYVAANAKAKSLAYDRNNPPPEEYEQPPEALNPGPIVELSLQAGDAYSALDRGQQQELDTKILCKLVDAGLRDSQTEPVTACKGGACFVYPRSGSASGARAIFRMRAGVVQVLELFVHHDKYDAARDGGFDLSDYTKFLPWRTLEPSEPQGPE